MVILSAVLIALAFLLAAATVHFRFANIRKEQAWRNLETKWRPLANRVISGEIPASALHQAVEPAERYFFVEFLARYATRFERHEKAILESLAEPYLPGIAARLDSEDPDIRSRAIITLGLLGPRKHVMALVEGLSAEEPITVLAAARALCALEDENAVRHVFLHIHKAELWSVSFLSRVIASAGRAAERPCREIMVDPDRSVWIRILAVESLRKLNDFEAADLARDLILSQSDAPPGVLCACLRLLKNIGTERHLDAIRHVWGSDNDAVRTNAIAALGGAGTRDDLPRLRLMVSDANQWVVWSAIRGIMNLGDRDFLRDLVKAGHKAGPAAQAVLDEVSAGHEGLLQAERL